MSSKVKKIVLAYSGGLDTSIILKWLQEKYQAEVVAYAADIGQDEELDGIPEKAKNTGAIKCYIEDLREEFVKDYIYRAVKANAKYEHDYLLGTSIARPLIAKRQVEIALKEGADAVSHGATGKGNDQVRFELTFKALAPELTIIAPWREWDLNSREQLIKYAEKHGIPVPVTQKKPYSMDRNFMHISYEGGILENPANEHDDDMFLLTTNPEQAPDKAEYVTIGFDKGLPVSVNGKKLSPIDLMKEVNTIAGRNGIGRVDIVENRLVGIKSRGVYETPGATILIEAHKALESITLDRDTSHYKQMIGLKYAELIYNGMWFHPLKDALDAFIDSTQETVTGEATLKLYKGGLITAGRKSNFSMYSEELATFEESDYDQSDATGFINLFGLQLKEAAKIKKKIKGN